MMQCVKRSGRLLRQSARVAAAGLPSCLTSAREFGDDPSFDCKCAAWGSCGGGSGCKTAREPQLARRQQIGAERAGLVCGGPPWGACPRLSQLSCGTMFLHFSCKYGGA